jgi:hypothetical protein
MRNITITLDEKIAAWARHRAAERDVSLSRFIGELLETTMRESREYRAAMQSFLSRQPTVLKDQDAQYPRREDLHDRNDLR